MMVTSRRPDELAQPWARQSLVQLAPVWGRITDPQTVQTTTSVQSEQRVPPRSSSGPQGCQQLVNVSTVQPVKHHNGDGTDMTLQ